jgi:hypothetical protein
VVNEVVIGKLPVLETRELDSKVLPVIGDSYEGAWGDVHAGIVLHT